MSRVFAALMIIGGGIVLLGSLTCDSVLNGIHVAIVGGLIMTTGAVIGVVAELETLQERMFPPVRYIPTGREQPDIFVRLFRWFRRNPDRSDPDAYASNSVRCSLCGRQFMKSHIASGQGVYLDGEYMCPRCVEEEGRK